MFFKGVEALLVICLNQKPKIKELHLGDRNPNNFSP